MSGVKNRDNVMIFGVDVLPQMSPLARSHPKYALTLLQGGTVAKRLDGVSKHRLLRLIRDYKPEIIAIDNVYELVPDADGLRHFVASLPLRTKVVQVTGSPTEALTLQEASIKHGLKPPAKFSPLEEAEASARLAALGLGCEVQALENETKILVCRSVSLGPGGSSQSRYRRRIHASILNATRRIQRALDEAGIDYDIFSEESDFGLERSEFAVYSSRASLYGIVKPKRGAYIRVSINPVFREKIDFVPRWGNLKGSKSFETKPLKKLIVGVDPGTTCGLAMLTFNAIPLYIESRKGLSRGDITRICTNFGEPVVVAADVTPVPNFVEKLAKSMNAVLFAPETVLDVVEKQALAQTYAQEHGVELKNPHERDALVAAIKAFQRYRNKFEQVEAHAKELGVVAPLDDIKALVVRGYSIQRAVEAFKPKPVEVVESPRETIRESPRVGELQNEIKRLQMKIADQDGQIRRLKKLNERLSEGVERLKSDVTKLKHILKETRSEQTLKIRMDREYQALHREIGFLRNRLSEAQLEIQQYQQRLERLRHYKELESKGEVVFLKPVEAFTKAGLEKAFQLYDIKRGDFVFLMDASGGGALTAEELARRGVRAVIAGTAMSHHAEETLKKYDIPVVPVEKLEIKRVEGYFYADVTELEKVIKGVKEAERSEAMRKLEEMVKGYKRERSGVS